MGDGGPVIGVTLDQEVGGDPAVRPGVYSRFPWYAVRENYFGAVAAAGGMPVGLGHEVARAAALVSRLDGLVVTGGAFDLDPALFGEVAHPCTVLKPERTRAEMALLGAALAAGIPVLGICGGMQLLAVAYGGRLIQHLPDEQDGTIAHEQRNPRDEAGHRVRLCAGSRLRAIVGAEEMAVNSSHHQAVRDAGRLDVAAVAPDGVIEAVEDPARRFCIGVQWHPEFKIDSGDKRLFDDFIRACNR